MVFVAPFAAQAGEYQYYMSQSSSFNEPFAEAVEHRYDDFIEFSSDLAGAPERGYETRIVNPTKYDLNTTFDRRSRNPRIQGLTRSFGSAPSFGGTSSSFGGTASSSYGGGGAYSSPAQTQPIRYPVQAFSPHAASLWERYELNPNSFYEEHRPARGARRNLTNYEKNAIYGQRSLY
ncbi:MAG TPA: hypothetical protein DD400_05045 [Rhodospirillaceae bacterium]|nr:hypothetical protein [Rhodospirillaceae bacterium]